MQPGRTHRHPRCEEGNLGCMTSQLLIGAKRWEPSGSSLGHCGNNALWIITRAARYHITYTKKGGGGLDPLERSLACMVPEARLEGPSLREAPGFRRMAPSPRSATNRPQACLLNAPRAHASSARKRGLDHLERSLACMVPEARLELARCCQRWILSPLRLPIPPLGHVMRELVYHSFLLISSKMELRAFR